MKSIKIVCFTCILLSCIQVHTQAGEGRLILGRAYAEQELKSALADTSLHNVVHPGENIIKDSTTAIAVAEPILFGIYGKSNITEQRPYEVYHIDHYWVLTGTLPQGWDGGTFLIIINDRNSEVIRITHGK
jgi:hypothetical protein